MKSTTVIEPISTLLINAQPACEEIYYDEFRQNQTIRMEIKRKRSFRTTRRARLSSRRFSRNSLLLDDFAGEEKNFRIELYKYPRNENSVDTVSQVDERKYLRNFQMVFYISQRTPKTCAFSFHSLFRCPT